MNHFRYSGGILHAEGVDLNMLADAVGTPFYCYSSATLERHYQVFAASFPKGTLVAFSVKALGNIAVLKTLARLGAGADVVSGGELKKAFSAPERAARLEAQGVVAATSTPQEFAAHLRREITRSAMLIKLTGAQAE